MRPVIQEAPTQHSPESLVAQCQGEPGVALLRSALIDWTQARYSFVAARPFLAFRSFGSRCELVSTERSHVQFGNPWCVLDGLMARYELLDEVDLPFPLGGCFGFWGYDLKNFVEPKLSRRAANDLELPDCQVGFYDSLVVFDHRLCKTWIVSTGIDVDGVGSEERASKQAAFWGQRLAGAPLHEPPLTRPSAFAKATADKSATLSPPGEGRGQGEGRPRRFMVPMHAKKPKEPSHEPTSDPSQEGNGSRIAGRGSRPDVTSNLSRSAFIAAVEQAQRYIRAGDIYQVNLAQRLVAPCAAPGWELYQSLAGVSPAPFAAFLDCGEFQIVSSSPESFLRLSGPHIQSRPIKGTRSRSVDPTRDAQLMYELQTSPKEMAELVMITDLLRNDLGKVCEYGSVQVPELVRLERFAQVQHLVSTVEGRLRADVTHFAALASCFPGGSVTGAPKIRAMEIIDELEPVTRGPYTGAIGYLGFNRESQLSIAIRAAICREKTAYFHVGAGIVADSIPSAEYDETLAKAGGFFQALNVAPECALEYLAGKGH